jgi:hypothetical protein
MSSAVQIRSGPTRKHHEVQAAFEIFKRLTHFLYNEAVTFIHLTAVAFIGCGVLLLAFSAK